MELWIRNQDKDGLIKIDNIYTWVEDDTVNLQSDFGINKSLILGRYKTKERALQVLDEIHQRLIDLQTLEIVPDFHKATKRCLDNVYEMPKDEEE